MLLLFQGLPLISFHLLKGSRLSLELLLLIVSGVLLLSRLLLFLLWVLIFLNGSSIVLELAVLIGAIAALLSTSVLFLDGAISSVKPPQLYLFGVDSSALILLRVLSHHGSETFDYIFELFVFLLSIVEVIFPERVFIFIIQFIIIK